MTIIQLQYIIAVDTYKSFAKAAKKCFVTQPTLSMQIKKVEEELSVLLFDRSKKPVLTTDIGKKVVAQAKSGLRELNRIQDIIKQQKGEVKGTLRIGIIPTLSPYLLPLFVTDFIEKYTQINLIVEELFTEQIIHKLNHDLIDLGILVTPLNQSNLREIPLFYEAFAVYMSTSHPLNKQAMIEVRDLDLDDMWLLKEEHCFRMQTVNICGKNNLPQNPNRLKFESGSLETLIKIVNKQFGYTLLPELATLDMNEAQRTHIKQFKNKAPMREVSIVVHRSFLKQRLIQLLKEEIISAVPAHLLDKDRGELILWN